MVNADARVRVRVRGMVCVMTNAGLGPVLGLGLG